MEKAVIQEHVSDGFNLSFSVCVAKCKYCLSFCSVLVDFLNFLMWFGYFLLWSAYTNVLPIFCLGVCVCVFLVDLKCFFSSSVFRMYYQSLSLWIAFFFLKFNSFKKLRDILHIVKFSYFSSMQFSVVPSTSVLEHFNRSFSLLIILSVNRNSLF